MTSILFNIADSDPIITDDVLSDLDLNDCIGFHPEIPVIVAARIAANLGCTLGYCEKRGRVILNRAAEKLSAREECLERARQMRVELPVFLRKQAN